jgi:hypothetical protein
VIFSPAGGAAPSRAGLLFWLLLALVATPYLFLRHPPYQDFPGHVAMLAIRERLGESPFLQLYFQRGSCWGPYGMFLGLGHALAPLLGPEGAMRLIGAVANCSLPLLLLVARRGLYPEPWSGAGYLGLCLSLGFMTAQGFTSFLLGLGAFAVAFCRWVTLLCHPQRPPRHMDWQVAALAVVTSFTHGFAFVLLMVCAALTIVIGRPTWRSILRARVFLPAAGLMVAVYFRDRGLYPPESTAPLMEFRPLWAKVQMLFLPTTFSRLGVDVAVAAVMWILLGGTIVATLRRRPSDNDELRRPPVVMAWTAVALFALALLAPKRFDFFGSLDIRLACTAILVAILGIDVGAMKGRLARALRIGPPILAAGMVATCLTAGLIFQREAGQAESVLRQIPDHARVLYLPMQPYSRVLAAMPFWHFEKRLLFDRDVLVSNVWLHQGTALRPTALGLRPLTVTPMATSDAEVPWAAYDLRPWDHVLVRNARTSAPRDAPSGLMLLGSSGGMHLYRNSRNISLVPATPGD